MIQVLQNLLYLYNKIRPESKDSGLFLCASLASILIIYTNIDQVLMKRLYTYLTEAMSKNLKDEDVKEIADQILTELKKTNNLKKFVDTMNKLHPQETPEV